MTENPTGSGKAKGGHARADSLTPERRSEIARAAAQKRWAGPRKPSVRKVPARKRLDATNIEVLAVSLFESNARASASGSPAWHVLTNERRDTWRQIARAMIAEQ